jgi:hypothetical protein
MNGKYYSGRAKASRLMYEPTTGSMYELQVINARPITEEAEPMRYALRNRDKLKEAFGEPFYLELIKCLSKHFQSNAANDRHEIAGVSHPCIKVAGMEAGTTHIFAVLGQTYDVVRLAYYKTEGKSYGKR